MRSLDDAINQPTLKQCSQCGVEKSIFDFYTRSDRNGRATAQCKACDSTRAVLGNQRRRLSPNGPAMRERARLLNRARLYGVTAEELAHLEAVTHCQVCGRTAAEAGHKGRSGRRLHIDHDHATGAVRGVLCKSCNSALGLAGDNPDRLRALISYLETSRAIA